MQQTAKSTHLLSRREAATYLRVSQRKLDAMIAAGELPRAKFGSSVRIDRADLDALIAAKKSA